MLFVILGEDGPDSLGIRKRVRPAHLERIAALVAEGRLVLAGPMPAVASPDPGPAGFTGSLIVAEFPSLAAAEDWIAADPYVTEGVFVRHSVRPFVRTAP